MAVKKAVKTKKVQIKTQETENSVEDFINSIADEQKQKDCWEIIDMMKKATKAEPKMWGSAIIGFGNTVYTSPATGRQVDWLLIGFSPRKANISLYIGIGNAAHADALKKLGKYKTGKGCLYINKLEDVDTKVLNTMIKTSAKLKM